MHESSATPAINLSPGNVNPEGADYKPEEQIKDLKKLDAAGIASSSGKPKGGGYACDPDKGYPTPHRS